MTSPSSRGPLARCWVHKDSRCGHNCPHRLGLTCLSGLHWRLHSGLLARHWGVFWPFPCLSPTLLPFQATQVRTEGVCGALKHRRSFLRALEGAVHTRPWRWMWTRLGAPVPNTDTSSPSRPASSFSPPGLPISKPQAGFG